MAHFRLFVVSALALCAVAARAYEQPVHKAMTARAFQRARADLLAKLGIVRDAVLLGQRPDQWMQQGAFDEDRIVPDMRSLHHFFDPTQMRPLNVSCIDIGFRADIWATDSYALGNAYAVADAKRHYEEAVLAPSAAQRTEAAKDLFVTLGHVVHMVQDMAQPEHTRNDQHLPGTEGLFQNGTEASVWEDWGGDNLKNIDESPVSFDGYPIVSLPDYRSYFHTGEKMMDGRPLGKGMADYANRNFVTQDTNYHDEDPSWSCPGTIPTTSKCFFHRYPKIEEAVRRTVASHYRILVDDAYETVSVEEDIFSSFSTDTYLGRTDSDPFHTHLSSLDLETREFGCDRLYSLSDGSYLSRAALLVPRAVGYSAGMIDRFFRGSVEVSYKKTAPGTYDVTLTNRSNEWLGHDATIHVVYRAPAGYFGTSIPGDTAPIIVARRTGAGV